MARRTINVPEELDRALLAVVAQQNRSYSNAVTTYLTSDASVPMLAQQGTHLEGEAAEILERTPEPTSEQPAARAVTLKASGKGPARSQVCVHRVPPGSYCKACDR